MKDFRQQGAINVFLVSTISLGILAVGLGAAFGWAYSQYSDYKQNSDEKSAIAAEAAKTEQKIADDKQFAEEYKKPNYTYKTPADYGSVTFNYPKTWSVYEENNGNDGKGYKAYFHPSSVPTIKDSTVYSLRLLVEDKSYDETLKSYDGAIKDGKLSSSPITLGQTETFRGYQGMRIDGQFDNEINGSAVIFKIRDKTLTIRADAQDYLGDFNNTILPSLKFEP
jgi:hypothetical protein